MRHHLPRLSLVAILALGLTLPTAADAKRHHKSKSKAKSAQKSKAKAKTAQKRRRANAFPSTLPKGKALKGVWSVVGQGNNFSTNTINYHWPLRSAPGAVVVPFNHDATDQGCPGNVENPLATRGKVCFYAGSFSNNLGQFGSIRPEDGVEMQVDRFGVVLFARGADPNLPFAVHGTWAVMGN
jgi:hypothetical protein